MHHSFRNTLTTVQLSSHLSGAIITTANCCPTVLNNGGCQSVPLVKTLARHLSSNPLFCNQAFINNRWVDAKCGNKFEVTDPATGLSLGQVPDMSVEDTNEAIKSAKLAQKDWAAFSLKERSSLLKKLHSSIAENKEALAEIITNESGKPLGESKVEVDYGNNFVEWFAEEAKRIMGDTSFHSSKRDARLLFIRQPVGVSALITPWNFPLAMITRKAAAALAAGCCVVIKPAEETPFTALALAKLCQMVDLPPGVVNVVTCSKSNVQSVGKTLCESKDVQKLSFTGSTSVGKHLYSMCSGTMKRLSMELGGCAPFIVFNSADVNRAVAGAMGSKFRNAGQTCVCANRFFIQSGIYEEFCSKMEEKIKGLKLGHGMKEGVTLGPLINSNAVSKVKYHVEDAVKRGAHIKVGGNAMPSLGPCFYQPTLLTNVDKNAVVNHEETFGPLAALTKFETEEEVLEMANNVRVGLASYFYTTDAAQMFRVSEALETGMVGVNEGIISTEFACFGGVKESGLGIEGSVYGIKEYQEIKYINLNF